jgi:hypothetical protein
MASTGQCLGERDAERSKRSTRWRVGSRSTRFRLGLFFLRADSPGWPRAVRPSTVMSGCSSGEPIIVLIIR